MIPRTSITDPTNIATDPYYNEAKYVGRGGYCNGNTNYQCVNFAVGETTRLAGRAVCYYSGISTKADITRPMFNRSGYGNAVNWWNDTLWPKGTEPKPGAIMVYGSNYGGGYGHVRVVEKVEGGKVFYAAANESRRMAFAWINAPKVTANGFLGYIYNPFIEETAQLEAKIEQLEASLQQAEELLAEQDKALKTAQNKLERIREIL